MSARGKCQACGVYANLETVKLSVRGKIVKEHELCRRCACHVEDAVRDAARTWRASDGHTYADRVRYIEGHP